MSGIGYYVGQSHKARELALKELGGQKTALMSDGDITQWLEDNYAIFWGDCVDDDYSHTHDEETIALVPNDVFESIKDSIVWLRR